MEEWDETKNTWYETISWRTDCRKYYWVRLHVPLPLHSHLPVLPCQQKPHFHYSWTGSWVHFHCHRTHQTSTRSGLVQRPHRDHLTNEPTVKLSVVFDNFKKKKSKKKNPMFQVNTVTSHLCTCWLRPQQLRQTARWCPCSHHWQPRPFLRERGGQHFHWRSSPRRLSNGLFPAQKHR